MSYDFLCLLGPPTRSRKMWDQARGPDEHRTLPKVDPPFLFLRPQKSISDSIYFKRHIIYILKFEQKTLCFGKKLIKLLMVYSEQC
jgi:hypothetical protein